MNLLLVEDDKQLASELAHSLKNLYLVDLAFTAEAGLYKAETNNYQLLIIDIGLPDFSGLELIGELRSDQIQTPILILSGFGSEHDKANGFSAGADDYLAKPFGLIELKARIKALIRRKDQIQTPKSITVGPIKFNCWTNSFLINKKPLRLSCKERMILACLLRNQGRIVTKAILREAVWGTLYPTSNSLQVYINRLRKKLSQYLKKPLIETAYGEGYIIRAQQF